MEEEEDRISQLPHPMLHHILSLLSQEEAVRTCTLSKSWRHLGPTRPKIEFYKSFFRGSEEKFISVVENTSQRYVDQKLSVQEFVLETRDYSVADSSISLLLNKWIPTIVVKKLILLLAGNKSYFNLTPVVFQSEFLEELFLHRCKLDQINNNVKLHMLKRLTLHCVDIKNETFDKIMSSCPLIEHVVLDSCLGLSTVKVNKARNLKQFVCYFSCITVYSIEIDEDATSLETIRIKKCRNWHHRHNNHFSFCLKSLFLWHVHLPTESLNNFSSNNCPCLEELEIRNCSGFSEFKLSNRSIKSLIIRINDRSIKAANVDVPSILYFELVGSYLPSISFATTSRKWKSRVDMWHYPDLYEILEALSQSRISLDISHLPLTIRDTYGYICEPVVVQRLCIKEHDSQYAFEDFLNSLFRFCRPRYIGLPLSANSREIYESQLVECVRKTLGRKGETRQQEGSDKNTNEWHPVRVCAMSNNQYIWFRLKWRFKLACLVNLILN